MRSCKYAKEQKAVWPEDRRVSGRELHDREMQADVEKLQTS